MVESEDQKTPSLLTYLIMYQFIKKLRKDQIKLIELLMYSISLVLECSRKVDQFHSDDGCTTENLSSNDKIMLSVDDGLIVTPNPGLWDIVSSIIKQDKNIKICTPLKSEEDSSISYWHVNEECIIENRQNDYLAKYEYFESDEESPINKSFEQKDL
ncbi:MAG: hypothetical protein MHPSP_001110, partial [Paramarteilia canceri]